MEGKLPGGKTGGEHRGENFRGGKFRSPLLRTTRVRIRIRTRATKAQQRSYNEKNVAGKWCSSAHPRSLQSSRCASNQCARKKIEKKLAYIFKRFQVRNIFSFLQLNKIIFYLHIIQKILIKKKMLSKICCLKISWVYACTDKTLNQSFVEKKNQDCYCIGFRTFYI